MHPGQGDLFSSHLDVPPAAAPSTDPFGDVPLEDHDLGYDPGGYDEEYFPEDDSFLLEETRSTPDPSPALPEGFEEPEYSTLPDALSHLATDPRIADLLDGLNDRQHEAVCALTGPVLVVAGPGSGKTRVLTHRVAALVRLGVPPWQVMAVTFTNKAAAEMRERIAALVGEEDASQMWVSTFHSACARLLRQYHAAANLPRAFTILDSSDVQRVLKSILTDAGASAEAGAVREIASAISRAKNAGKTSQELLASIKPSDRADGHLMSLYDQRLLETGSVDFDDLLCKAVELLRTHEPAREWIRKRSRFLLVDEFQDTNAVQLELLRLMAAPSEGFSTASGPGTLTQYLRASRGNICVVGDFDQSVYSWRGADPTGMSEFTSEYIGTRVVVLEQNYRSTKSILEVVQSIIDPNPALHRPNLFTENPTGSPVRLYVAADDRDEADWVVTNIKRVGGALSDHAVLVRTNAQTRVFEEQLTRTGLPYQVVGALRFYDRAEVKDAVSYLRVVANPQDLVSLGRCINTPKRGIGEASVAALVSLSRTRGEDPISTLRAALPAGELPARSRRGFESFLEAYDLVLAAAQVNPAEALRSVADDTGLRTALAADKTSGIDRVENLDSLIDGAETFVQGASPTSPEGQLVSELSGWEQTLAFLENVALVSAADSEEVAVPKVSLLTAHASKGKEFPHVYVVGVEDGLYPHERSKDTESGIEEERRLLFVACSRAEETLSISRALTRFVFNKPQENKASPFLSDLPGSVVTVPPRKRTQATPAWGRGGGRPFPQRPTSQAASYGFVSRPAPAAPKAPPGPRLKPEQLSKGVGVKHRVFGTGIVEEVSGTKATIRFGTQAKVLDLDFAPLELA